MGGSFALVVAVVDTVMAMVRERKMRKCNGSSHIILGFGWNLKLGESP